MSARDGFPIGSALTLAEYETAPYTALARLRAAEPVSWVSALGGWLISSRELALEALRDAETFTVDDPRFSTGAVIGPSMLSVDGDEHTRLRTPFVPPFRPVASRQHIAEFVEAEAERLAASLAVNGHMELRTELAGPLAVNTITAFLGLLDVEAEEVLRWYGDVSDAIVDFDPAQPISLVAQHAVDAIGAHVAATIEHAADSLLATLATSGQLAPDEIVPSAMVLMFGAIETSEGMTTNVLWHLLGQPGEWERVSDDRTLVADAIEESLRLEPAAAVVDRYATRDVVVGGATIPAGDLVVISLLGANRDPAVFDDPDSFVLDRPNSRQHLAFAQGPHTCIGLHLARLETAAALNAVLDVAPQPRLDVAGSSPPAGRVFRKAHAVRVTLG